MSLSQSQNYLTTCGQTASLAWCQTTIWDPWPIFFFFSLKFSLDSCVFVIMGFPLWREDRSVIYSCFWVSPAQSFSGKRSAGLMTKFYCPKFQTLPSGGPGSCICCPQKHSSPVIPPDIGLSNSLHDISVVMYIQCIYARLLSVQARYSIQKSMVYQMSLRLQRQFSHLIVRTPDTLQV
jgi:hypothetical protein